MADSRDSPSVTPKRVLLWSVEEARRRGVHQIGASACGATALLNAFAALGTGSHYEPAEVNAAVATHLRRPGGGLKDYLQSRAAAGATHEDLINACKLLPDAKVSAHFVAYCDVTKNGTGFLEWCYDEVCAGGVPVLCMNLQQLAECDSPNWIPDAWHHQMVFGVDLDRRVVYLANPLCEMTELDLHRVLLSERVLLVRDQDVYEQAQLGASASAEDLSAISPAWSELDVGKCASDIVKAFDPSLIKHSYLKIPAAYQTGATVLRRCSGLVAFMRSCADGEVHYTTHRNWDWVVEEALQHTACELGLPLFKKPCSRDMPSRKSAPRSKPQYALFRIEITSSTTRDVQHSAWATSQALEFLDPKDALYMCLNKRGHASLMPPTILLPWDFSSVEQLGELPECLMPSTSNVCMLKAALGSGGYGLYFVDTIEDVLGIAKNHAAKATQVPNFVSNLKRDYEEVPSWSLQYLVPSMRVSDGRKCQFRSYVVVSGKMMYFYRTIEARIVCWETSATSSSEMRPDEEAFCAGTSARPYNQGRMKVRTDRVLIDEIDTLKRGEAALTECTTAAFKAVRPDIEARMESSDDTSLGGTRMAVAGVDLLLDANYNAYIVEINNNPAMPAESKRMSAAYRRHLKILVADMIKLGLSNSTHETNFTRIWD